MNKLPSVILAHICGFLDGEDTLEFSAVNKYINVCLESQRWDASRKITHETYRFRPLDTPWIMTGSKYKLTLMKDIPIGFARLRYRSDRTTLIFNAQGRYGTRWLNVTVSFICAVSLYGMCYDSYYAWERKGISYTGRLADIHVDDGAVKRSAVALDILRGQTRDVIIPLIPNGCGNYWDVTGETVRLRLAPDTPRMTPFDK